MAINLLSPADGLLGLLAPGGVPLGSIGNVVARTPDVPYMGACPLVMIRPLPIRGEIAQEGARGYVINGQLDLWYLDTTASEQGRTLAAIEADAGANLALIVDAILSDRTLAGSVISIAPPIQYLGDEEGPYVQVADRIWFYLAMRIPFLGAGGQVYCF